jgi:hypothetical protein
MGPQPKKEEPKEKALLKGILKKKDPEKPPPLLEATEISTDHNRSSNVHQLFPEDSQLYRNSSVNISQQ